LTTQQPKRKEEAKREEREKEAELMNSGLCLFLNLGFTSTQVGSMVKKLTQNLSSGESVFSVWVQAGIVCFDAQECLRAW